MDVRPEPIFIIPTDSRSQVLPNIVQPVPSQPILNTVPMTNPALQPFEAEKVADSDGVALQEPIAAATEAAALSDTNGKCCDMKIVSRPVLGRTVYLGDLYNANNEEILSGNSFWNPSTIERNKIRCNARSSSVNVLPVETMEDRLSQMGLSSGMKLDYMGELALYAFFAYILYFLLVLGL